MNDKLIKITYIAIFCRRLQNTLSFTRPCFFKNIVIFQKTQQLITKKKTSLQHAILQQIVMYGIYNVGAIFRSNPEALGISSTKCKVQLFAKLRQLISVTVTSVTNKLQSQRNVMTSAILNHSPMLRLLE